MTDYKILIDYIQAVIDRLFALMPSVQQQMLAEVLRLTKDLELRDNVVRVSVQNLKSLSGVKAVLTKAIVTPRYESAVGDYVKAFDQVTNLQNQYFTTIDKNFSAPSVTKELLKQAKESVIESLTQSGLEANVTGGVQDIIRRAITTGSSYETLQNQLNDYLTGTGEMEGQLTRYTKQISTDAINQYSRQYSKLVSDDLGLEWFRYAGSNLKTSRPFCLACTDRKYFHISEIPTLLKGDFPEFKKFDGKIYAKTGLPQGMYPETDVSNFSVLLGGYNCGHQYRPVTERLVPEDIKQGLYGSAEYKMWKGMDIPKEDGKREKLTDKPTAFSNVTQQKLQKFPDKDYFQKKYYKSGGVSAVHRRADKGDDYAENIKSAEMYAKIKGYTAEVNRHAKKPGVRNAELTLNGKLADNKKPNHSDYSKGTPPYKNIASAISNGARSAIEQDAIPIIILEKRYNLKDVTSGVRYGFEAVDKKTGKQVEEIHLRYRDEAITIISRKEYLSGDYVQKIRDGYKPPLK